MNTLRYVKNWFVTKDPNNVYNLVINTTQRYCYHYHLGGDEANNMLFVVAENEDQDFADEEGLILEVPYFLPPIEGTWLQASITVKDQIHYYFIPHLWEWPQDIILRSQNLQ